MVIQVTKAGARRFLLHAQGLLEAPGVRPWAKELRGKAGTAAALGRLEAVQLDPISVVERNHHLVLRNRVGGYRPEHLDRLFADRQVFEYLANARCVLPMADLPGFWPIMLEARQLPARETLAGSMAEVVTHLRANGEAPPREMGNEGPRLMGIGYNPADKASKASGRAIDLLWLGGEILVSRRRGNEKWYDLAERVVPPAVAELLPGGRDALALPGSDAPGSPGETPGRPGVMPGTPGMTPTGEGGARVLAAGEGTVARPWSTPSRAGSDATWHEFLLDKYMRAFRLADLGDFRFGWQNYTAAERRALAAAKVEAGEWVEVAVEGVRRRYYALAADRPLLEAAEGWKPSGPVRFIAPLDSLLWRRERLQDLFDFDYTWEVYTPAAKRRYGYYAMPILYHDRLIGRLDPRLDRKQGVLVVNLLQLEPGVKETARLKAALEKALQEFARWHGVEEVRR